MNSSPDLARSFKAYDVRGIVGDSITADTSRAVGAAFVDELQLAGSRVLVGGDMRESSPDFAAAFAEGAASRGARVSMLGLISTDELYYASGSMNCAGAIFTASHNPQAYNGIKMVKAGALPISSETGMAGIQARAQSYLAEGIPASEAVTHTVSSTDVLADYAAYLRGLVDLSSSRPLKIVVDAGNGMAGLTAPAVLGDAILPGLPLTIIPLYFELDGTFPNHPANPLEPENLRDLQRAVTEHGADLGLAFDGDADRCFVVDEKGNPVSPSAVTAIIARREIAKALAAGGRKPAIIHNLITSRAVPELIEREGGTAVRTRVGHSFIKDVMSKEGAVFGGEHSAHYYFRDFWNADTGMLAAMHVLAAVGEQMLPLSDFAREFEPYFSSGELNSRVDDLPAAVDRVTRAFSGAGATIDDLDGLTFSAVDGSWWFNVRASNTEPYLRLNAEAEKPEALSLLVEGVLAAISG